MKTKKNGYIYDIYSMILWILLLITTYLLVMVYLPYIIADIAGLLGWKLPSALGSIINIALYLALLKVVIRFCDWPVAAEMEQKFTSKQKETVFLIAILFVSVAFIILGAISPWIGNISYLQWIRKDAGKFIECGANGILLCIGFAVSLKDIIAKKGKGSVIKLFMGRLRDSHKLGVKRTCLTTISFTVYVFVMGIVLSALEGWLSQLVEKM